MRFLVRGLRRGGVLGDLFGVCAKLVSLSLRVAERDGQLILKVAGPPLLPLGSVVTVKDALLPPDVYSRSLVSGAAAKGGNVNLVSFPLDLLPTMVL